MNKDSTIADADKLLSELSKSISPQSLKWMKENFEKHAPSLISGSTKKLEISFVIDTNNILRALMQYSKGKKSLLFNLLGNPMFRLYAPKQALREVLSVLLAKKNINLNKALEGWDNLKNVIKFDDAKSKHAVSGAMALIGSRDPKDIPFVALYLQLGAVGIMTDDKDFDHPQISKMNIEKVGEMVARFHRGVLSFVVLHDLAPVTLKALFDVLVVAVTSLFNVLKFLFSIVSNILVNAVGKVIELFANLPPWIQGVIFGILAGAGITLLLNADLRNSLVNKLVSVWEEVKPKLIALLDWIRDNSDNIMEKLMLLAPYVECATIILLNLANNIAKVVEETKLNAARVALSAT